VSTPAGKVSTSLTFELPTLIIVKTRMVDFYTLVSLEGCFISSICAGNAFPAAVHPELGKNPIQQPKPVISESATVK
jgi:hypothetical protein